jgi:hypothetical protein
MCAKGECIPRRRDRTYAELVYLTWEVGSLESLVFKTAVRDTKTRVDIAAGNGGLFVERHAETDLRKLDEHFDRLRVGLAKANRHSNKEFAVNFDNTFVSVYCLELQAELDLRQEEVVVFDVSSACQSVEEVQVNRFLDLQHDAREETAALRRNGQPRWLHLNI